MIIGHQILNGAANNEKYSAYNTEHTSRLKFYDAQRGQTQASARYPKVRSKFDQLLVGQRKNN